MADIEPFPNKDSIEFKDKFVERYSKLTDFEEWKKYSLAFPRKAIRVNTLKISVEELKKRLEENWVLEQVPWCKEGFWITHKEGRRDIGNLKEHALGYIYVQEASSMIPGKVLFPDAGDKVLDMCAAPGSKTTQMCAYMENKGLVFANDVEGIRLAPLGINIQRMGITNCVLTIMPGQRYAKSGMVFDKILVDAPCSGTGTVNKSPGTLKMWNPAMIKRLAIVQRNLIKTAYDILKPGGIMVYSTCSNEPEEDEGVIDWLLKGTDAKLLDIDLDIKRSDPIVEFEDEKYNPEVRKCLRIWPQDNHTEGFFVTKILKPGKNN
ncbi:RsmB/NOP family class I SAM-dependent RNA methyltransferase [Candidatus Woesearchaeota archaeon]|nr:RsmB/NOP family class I SAM-dependent RNA methyltransferase [Candidatus Woesearchaeota archaeon]